MRCVHEGIHTDAIELAVVLPLRLQFLSGTQLEVLKRVSEKHFLFFLLVACPLNAAFR